jgi:hypothetical protein
MNPDVISNGEGSPEHKHPEEIYFAYSATLRVAGDIPDLDAISQSLGLSPTHAHRRGERKGPRSPEYRSEMWMFTAPVDEERPLHEHIDSLWTHLEPHREQILELKRRHKVDVFLGYRSNCGSAGVEVPHSSLEMFIQLGIPFGLSIIFA